MSMDSGDFRQALGRFATGVCLVTVNDPELGPLATTVNSFSSVSLDPPLVLWSIQNSSDHLGVYTDCEHFGISVLTADQASAVRAVRGAGRAQRVARTLRSRFGGGAEIDRFAGALLLRHACGPSRRRPPNYRW